MLNFTMKIHSSIILLAKEKTGCNCKIIAIGISIHLYSRITVQFCKIKAQHIFSLVKYRSG